MKNVLIIGVIIIALGTGYVFFTNQSSTVPTDESQNNTTQNTSDGEGSEVIQYSASLNDVAGGNASGVATAQLADNQYILTAEFSNLDPLDEGFFYEGWVVRSDPLSVISTGPLEDTNGEFVNNYTSTEDLTDHIRYVLTLEPDDGDPAPAEHVVEGDFEMIQ